jgi:hypothetical protein
VLTLSPLGLCANRMCKLIKFEKGEEYVDLTVTFEVGPAQEVPGPPVRYYFNL